MKIILLDKIQRLGEIGDIVEVNSGYARNFLIPQKKAAFASDKNIAEVEANMLAIKDKHTHKGGRRDRVVLRNSGIVKI